VTLSAPRRVRNPAQVLRTIDRDGYQVAALDLRAMPLSRRGLSLASIALGTFDTDCVEMDSHEHLGAIPGAIHLDADHPMVPVGENLEPVQSDHCE
jgi:hypothetical protein